MKNAQGLLSLIITCVFTLVFRLVIVIITAMYISKFNQEISDYTACVKQTGLVDDSNYVALLCADKYLTVKSYPVEQYILKAFIVALVLALVWTVISLVGIITGSIALPKEQAADVESGRGVAMNQFSPATATIVVSVQQPGEKV